MPSGQIWLLLDVSRPGRGLRVFEDFPANQPRGRFGTSALITSRNVTGPLTWVPAEAAMPSAASAL